MMRTSAPRIRSSSRLPSAGATDWSSRRARTRIGFIPSRREPAAVIRAQLDCTPAQVTTLSLPFATASARMKSSFRALLPPKASPVWSSRLTKRRGPPSSAASVGISSNGVGRWARGACSKRLTASSKMVMGSAMSPSRSPAPTPPHAERVAMASPTPATSAKERSANMGDPPERASLRTEVRFGVRLVGRSSDQRCRSASIFECRTRTITTPPAPVV